MNGLCSFSAGCTEGILSTSLAEVLDLVKFIFVGVSGCWP